MTKEYKKLKRVYEDIDGLIANKVKSDSPDFKVWRERTKSALIAAYGENSRQYKQFQREIFSPTVLVGGVDNTSKKIDSCARGLQSTKAMLQVCLEDMEEDETMDADDETLVIPGAYIKGKMDKTKVFIVCGHDMGLTAQVELLLTKQGIEGIVISEKPTAGRTIIEQVERYSNVMGAICLFTPDDEGKEKNDSNLKSRARQNVIFEAGYFYGKIGRANTVILVKDDNIEMPSDLSGILHVSDADWKSKLLSELATIGYNIDKNKM